ncbi:asparagine synthase (glutamine-hydrolyzing) [Bradyrhizobium septentrionale]|uniref:asparagine synthase (glutamine-hydrolyzing) n=1 Tax=Bradyrhizobium septentrionale TaxID=1404411 RepID=UPI001596D675|nr:asparagine synthase (glutamine-hydrolyzing) [Bradyrhizobium septentrionale]UGY29633.1 asparagine synthase (glutamine-hydrolyzing) [Bradyrhizobium septentrionale]
MCGICGIFRISGGQRVSWDVIKAMTQTLAHRGPDDCGHFVNDGVGLGFRRLSIIDLFTGNQPLANEDQTIFLVCNGEIFNHRELRAEMIAKGHRFRSQTDVEVLIHLYEELGDGFLGRINGQFAFMLFDSVRNRLFGARDQFGIAPLFYATVGRDFVFGSEIKAVLAYPGIERRVDLTGLDQVLSLPGLVSPRTMFAGINSLPPGHCITVNEHGVRTAAFWDLIFPAESEGYECRSESSYRDEIEHCLVESVRRRLQADVPVGAYLSGGLDSSLVTSIMQANVADPVRTFSIAFDQQLIDERQFQRIVARDLGCRHHEVELDVNGIESRLRGVIWHAECPLKETYNTASLVLSAAARAHGVPVVLSGEGADELFAGYLGYRFDAFRRSRGAPGPTPAREAELRFRVFGDATVFYEKNLTDIETGKLVLYSPALGAQFRDFDFTKWDVIDTSRLKNIHPLHQRSYLDMKLRLGDHLVGDHGDRMLLANGVEGRFPFLDIEVAELACRMPPDLKLRGYEEKYILKEMARKYVPQSIIEREKYGFNAPGTPFLLRSGVEWVEELLSPETIRRQGYFDPAAVAELKHRYSQPGFHLNVPTEDDVLLTVLTFGLFLEAFDMPDLGQ